MVAGKLLTMACSAQGTLVTAGPSCHEHLWQSTTVISAIKYLTD